MFGKLSRIIGISSVGLALSYQGFNYFQKQDSKVFTTPENINSNPIPKNNENGRQSPLNYSEIYANHYLPVSKKQLGWMACGIIPWFFVGHYGMLAILVPFLSTPIYLFDLYSRFPPRGELSNAEIYTSKVNNLKDNMYYSSYAISFLTIFFSPVLVPAMIMNVILTSRFASSCDAEQSNGNAYSLGLQTGILNGLIYGASFNPKFTLVFATVGLSSFLYSYFVWESFQNFKQGKIDEEDFQDRMFSELKWVLLPIAVASGHIIFGGLDT